MHNDEVQLQRKKNTLIKIPVAVNRKRFPNITKVLVDHDVIQAELMLKDK